MTQRQRFLFYRFEFSHDKDREPLFAACYGDDPEITTEFRYMRRHLTTTVWAMQPMGYRCGTRETLKIFVELKPDGTATIDDIQNWSHCVNRDYGSMAWTFTESVLYSFHYHTIAGLLAPDDFDHRDRPVHFYEKIRFTVTLGGKCRSIGKSLINTAP